MRLFGGVRGGWVCEWGGVGGWGEGGSRYADIICRFCIRKVTTLPFMIAKILWMSSPNSIKDVQVICIFNSLTDYFNT